MARENEQPPKLHHERSSRHHTLWPDAEYKKAIRTAPHNWRGSTTMIITLPNETHRKIHDTVTSPGLPSVELAERALNFCRQQYHVEQTKIRAFSSVRDELHRISQEETLYSAMGREALKFCEFLSSQLDIIIEVPILGEDYHEWGQSVVGL